MQPTQLQICIRNGGTCRWRSCGEGASKRWPRNFFEDAAASASSAAALTFGASNGTSVPWEVSDDGVISYTASDDLLASLQEGEAATDSIYYAVRDGSEFSVNIAEVTIRLEKGEAEYEGIANLTATGADNRRHAPLKMGYLQLMLVQCMRRSIIYWARKPAGPCS